MPEFETKREDVRALNGLHLWHAPMSNCSQRVRLAMAEKRIEWTGHPVDLARNEQTSPEFLALNPNGVVPVLVHDGKTYLESNDIIAYLDATFPGPQLKPAGEADRKQTAELMAAAGSVQGALKLLSFEFLFKIKAIKGEDELAAYAASGTDPKLVAFHQELSAGRGFSQQRITEAVRTMDHAFAQLEARLQNFLWLSGPSFGLADISWLVNVHRLTLMRYSLSRYPRLADWHKRCMKRPNARKEISGFEPAAMRAIFWINAQVRRLKGSGINSFRH